MVFGGYWRWCVTCIIKQFLSHSCCKIISLQRGIIHNNFYVTHLLNVITGKKNFHKMPRVRFPALASILCVLSLYCCCSIIVLVQKTLFVMKCCHSLWNAFSLYILQCLWPIIKVSRYKNVHVHVHVYMYINVASLSLLIEFN